MYNVTHAVYVSTCHVICDMVQVMECYSRWTTPIHQLPKTPPTVEARLRDITENRGGFTQKISECLSENAQHTHSSYSVHIQSYIRQ